jgi:hypothetical protein
LRFLERYPILNLLLQKLIFCSVIDLYTMYLI